MVSVMNDCEIDRKSAAAGDRSFFGMELPENEPSGAETSRSHAIGGSGDSRASSDLDPAVRRQDLDSRASETEFDYRLLSPESNSGSSDGSRVLESDEISLSFHGFEIGDMVWGKVKSHPWWPGHIFNEAFASPSVRRTKREGHVLAAFFGDSSYGWFDPAELIPFAPHFAEKSRQTTSRTFVRAVEEAVDEASRRGALGLSCRCRNPCNFRPTNVSGYFAVDVVGFEPGGIYSANQIKKARDEFVPLETLSFVHQLAVMPKSGELKSVDFIQSVAVVTAFRRAVYEEFDETYAQAFGIQPVRPTPNDFGVLEQTERYTPRVAPLSGPLVFAEALGEKKSLLNKRSAPSTRAATSSAKKNKYLLKRREDARSFSDQGPKSSFVLPSFPSTETPRPEADSSGYVLQKREVQLEGVGKSDELHPPSAATEAAPAAVATECRDSEGVRHVDAAVKKLKVKKRSYDDAVGGSGKEELKKKKKKKKVSVGADHPTATGGGEPQGRAVSVPEGNRTSGDTIRAVPRLDFPVPDTVEIPQLVSDLCQLALDPFHGYERNASSLVCGFFLKFRSLVYQKSLVLPPPAEPDSQEAQVRSARPAASLTESKEQRAPSAQVQKPSKFVKRPDDPTKAGRKRAPSDRQEEMSAKKTKKLGQIKTLASDKKETLKDAGTSAVATTTTTSAAELAKRQEPLLPLPPKKESPTYLVMKFPPRSTLPSVANLKARFARFGPLDVDGTRVFWKSHSCRVQFRFKVDAMSAYSYVRSNNLFGQIQVNYHVREVEAPAPDLALEKRRQEGQADRPGNGGSSGSQPRPALFQQPGRLPKSILKKPGDDGGGPPPKENQRVRVKFMLGGEESKVEPPPVLTGSSNFADTTPLPLPPVPSRSVGFLPTPPPMARPVLPQAAVLPPARPFEPPSISLPVPPPPQHRAPMSRLSEAQLRQQVHQYGGGEAERRSQNVDISHQMISLLVRCNDIVTGLRSLPGYVPYRPL